MTRLYRPHQPSVFGWSRVLLAGIVAAITGAMLGLWVAA